MNGPMHLRSTVRSDARSLSIDAWSRGPRIGWGLAIVALAAFVWVIDRHVAPISRVAYGPGGIEALLMGSIAGAVLACGYVACIVFVGEGLVFDSASGELRHLRFRLGIPVRGRSFPLGSDLGVRVLNSSLARDSGWGALIGWRSSAGVFRLVLSRAPSGETLATMNFACEARAREAARAIRTFLGSC